MMAVPKEHSMGCQRAFVGTFAAGMCVESISHQKNAQEYCHGNGIRKGSIGLP